jgi:RNA polymerase sigma factor (TIGR02999 family)
VYDELRRIAGRWFRGQRTDHTLQPTALIHEAWLRLARATPDRYADRHHFLAVAATAMKQVLINHARGRNAACRGGGWTRVHLDRADRGEPVDPEVLLDLAEALDQLEGMDARKAAIAEMRLLGGLTLKEIAARLGCSMTTVEDHWRTTRAWLAARLEAAGSTP